MIINYIEKIEYKKNISFKTQNFKLDFNEAKILKIPSKLKKSKSN